MTSAGHIEVDSKLSARGVTNNKSEVNGTWPL